MIAKCAVIALCAAVAAGCVFPSSESFLSSPSTDVVLQSAPSAEVVLPSTPSAEFILPASQPTGVVVPSFGSSGSSSGSITRNLVGKGKYPVALKSCGPTPDQQIPVTTSHVTAPVQVKPTVRLPARIPAPRVISHTCTCYKTVLRPRVQQKVVTVPVIQRYIETTHKPVIENIQYEAQPVGCGSSSGSSQVIELSSGSSSSGSVELLSSGSQSFQVPSVQVVEAPRVQVVEAPRVQAVEVPSVQVVEAPRVQVVEAPRVQAVEIPQIQTVQVPQVQTVEIPQVQAVEVPQIQAVAMPSFGSSSCGVCA